MPGPIILPMLQLTAVNRRDLSEVEALSPSLSPSLFSLSLSPSLFLWSCAHFKVSRIDSNLRLHHVSSSS